MFFLSVSKSSPSISNTTNTISVTFAVFFILALSELASNVSNKNYSSDSFIIEVNTIIISGY